MNTQDNSASDSGNTIELLSSPSSLPLPSSSPSPLPPTTPQANVVVCPPSPRFTKKSKSKSKSNKSGHPKGRPTKKSKVKVPSKLEIMDAREALANQTNLSSEEIQYYTDVLQIGYQYRHKRIRFSGLF